MVKSVLIRKIPYILHNIYVIYESKKMVGQRQKCFSRPKCHAGCACCGIGNREAGTPLTQACLSGAVRLMTCVKTADLLTIAWFSGVTCVKKRFIAHVGIVNGTQKSRMKKSTSENQSASLVEIDGVEPTTLCLQSRCSSQLSYIPVCVCKYRYFYLYSQKLI